MSEKKTTTRKRGAAKKAPQKKEQTEPTLSVQVQRMADIEIEPPKVESKGAAAYDLRSAERVRIQPGQQAKVKTGFAWAIPRGYVGLIRPRSGMAVRDHIDIRAGVIDSDYRGEVVAVLRNEGSTRFDIDVLDRIAQLVIVPCLNVQVELVDDLPTTERGDGGFGHTGK